MEDKDYKGYYYKEYYVEEKHYRDELKQIDYFKAAKLFTDGSSDDFFTYSLEELYKIIESRTDNDIILNHYKILQKVLKLDNINLSLEEYKKNNIINAISLLKQIDTKGMFLTNELRLKSLITHLKRISKG